MEPPRPNRSNRTTMIIAIVLCFSVFGAAVMAACEGADEPAALAAGNMSSSEDIAEVPESAAEETSTELESEEAQPEEPVDESGGQSSDAGVSKKTIASKVISSRAESTAARPTNPPASYKPPVSSKESASSKYTYSFHCGTPDLPRPVTGDIKFNFWERSNFGDSLETGTDFPIVFTSAEDVRKYFDAKREDNAHRIVSDMPGSGWEYLYPILEYNPDYFNDKVLLLFEIVENSGSIYHTVDRVKTTYNDTIEITITRHVPEMVTCDMAKDHVYVEISKDDYKGRSIKTVLSKNWYYSSY